MSEKVDIKERKRLAEQARVNRLLKIDAAAKKATKFLVRELGSDGAVKGDDLCRFTSFIVGRFIRDGQDAKAHIKRFTIYLNQIVNNIPIVESKSGRVEMPSTGAVGLDNQDPKTNHPD